MHVSIHRRESSVPMTPSQAERQARRLVLPFLAHAYGPRGAGYGQTKGGFRVGCRWLGAGWGGFERGSGSRFWSLSALVLPLCSSEVLSLPSMTRGKPLVSWTDLPLLEIVCLLFSHSHPNTLLGRGTPWPLTLPSVLVCRDAMLWEAGFPGV